MIQLRNAALSLLALQPQTLEEQALDAALAQHPALAGLDETLPVVLDLGALKESSAEERRVDWPALRARLAAARLLPVGVRNGAPALRSAAAQAGWADLGSSAASGARRMSETEEPGAEAVVGTPPPAEVPPPPPPLARPTLYLDKPLRSGQKVYARGGDAVVLAMVSPGAEVIADGNIHIYAPLRGRALAGATGDLDARIFVQAFEPELVSIAGVWRNYADGIDAALRGRPAQVRLVVDAQREYLDVSALAL